MIAEVFVFFVFVGGFMVGNLMELYMINKEMYLFWKHLFHEYLKYGYK